MGCELGAFNNKMKRSEWRIPRLRGPEGAAATRENDLGEKVGEGPACVGAPSG